MTYPVVRELKESEWSNWDAWLALQPWGSPFSSAWWLDANCRAFGGHPLLLGVLDGEELVGGVALRVKDAGFVHMVGFPLLYGPVVVAARGPHRMQQALGVLLEDMTRRRLVIPSLACTPDVVDLRQAVWRHWDLTSSWTVVSALGSWALGNDVSRPEREKVRKAQRSGVTACVELPDANLLYDLQEVTMSRQDARLHESRRQVRILVEGAGAHGMQVVVRDRDGTPLSVDFVMAHGTRVAYAIWSGTSPSGLAKGAAVARCVFLLQELQARGYEFFDWCGANLPGVSDF